MEKAHHASLVRHHPSHMDDQGWIPSHTSWCQGLVCVSRCVMREYLVEQKKKKMEKAQTSFQSYHQIWERERDDLMKSLTCYSFLHHLLFYIVDPTFQNINQTEQSPQKSYKKNHHFDDTVRLNQSMTINFQVNPMKQWTVVCHKWWASLWRFQMTLAFHPKMQASQCRFQMVI